MRYTSGREGSFLGCRLERWNVNKTKMKSNPPKFIPGQGYQELVKRIRSELAELDIFIKRRTAESYWRIGKFIHEHLLESKNRAGYSDGFYERLSADADMDPSTLSKTVRFYKTYPILAAQPKLTWSHFKVLITVQDEAQRNRLEKQIVENGWDFRRLQKYLNTKRELEGSPNDPGPVPRLSWTRGAPDCFEVVQDDGQENFGRLVADFGFRQTLPLPTGAKYKEGDIVEFPRVDEKPALNQNGSGPAAVKTDVKKEEIYTYPAEVLKVIDGDTLLVRLGVAFGIAVRWKLRLRGIDCPEIDTSEGKAAKRFFENRLKDCAFIVVKTYKDRTDIFDRYLADIFYKTGISSQGQAASEGIYLNQELLDNRLAVLYEPY